MIVKQASSRARFDPRKMGKVDLLLGDHLFAGLNAFEPGQRHEPHAHCDRDKLYVVLEGSGELTIGQQSGRIAVGDVALAPAGVTHSVGNPGPGRLVLMAILSPPPTSGE
jgi:quercetin dioxygenase-like cupin family protein